MPNRTPAGDAELREQIRKIMYGTEGDRALAMENWIIARDQSQREALLEEIKAEMPEPYRSGNELNPEVPYDPIQAAASEGEKYMHYKIMRVLEAALHQLKDPERS